MFDILPWAFYLDRIASDASFASHESTVPFTSNEFDAIDVKSLGDVLHLKAFFSLLFDVLFSSRLFIVMHRMVLTGYVGELKISNVIMVNDSI